MWLIDLLFSFQGRIPRSQFWLGILVLVPIAMVGFFVILGPAAFDPDAPLRPPSLAQNLFALLLLVPVMALTKKRLNDRDWPAQTILFVIAAFLPQYIGPFFGYMWDVENFTPAEYAVLAVSTLVSFWLLVDNGILKGTSGTNTHGPDTLAAAA